MGIKFSKKAIRANFLVENPDWYQYKITDVKKKRTQDGTSWNYFYIFEGLGGEMEGVPVTYMANEKADWLHYPIFKAANGGVDLEPDTEVQPESVSGISMEAYTKRGSRNDGTPANVFTEFRPIPESTQG